MYILGEKCDDQDSPAYVPLLFSFTDSPAKCRAECDLKQWKAAKQRHLVQQSNEASTTEGPLAEETSDEEIDIEVVTETHCSLSCQTDMTMLDLDKMETENVQINEELKLFHEKTYVTKRKNN